MPKSINGAAEYLCVGRTTIYRLMALGELEYCKIGRRTIFQDEVLDAFLAKNTERQAKDVNDD